MLVIECKPDILTINQGLYPDVETSYVYDHLKYYCSKFSPLPAVTITLVGGSPVVVQGHKYAQIAQELGRASVRAIMTDNPDKDQVQRFVQTEGVKVLDWQSLRREEENTSVLDARHVFFFDLPLSDEQRRIFEERIAAFFRGLQSVLLHDKPRIVTTVVYSHDEQCAEFTATTPAGDPRWFGDFHAACLDFSRRVARIASYQGRRFVS